MHVSHLQPGSIVAIIGLCNRQFQTASRLLQQHGVTALYGGCIDDGSNAPRYAARAAERADVILWNPRFSRYLGSRFFIHRVFAKIKSVSAIRRLVV
jgi:hypothetical protein